MVSGQIDYCGTTQLLLRYEAKEAKEKKKICRELTSAILLRYILTFAISYFARSVKLRAERIIRYSNIIRIVEAEY